MPFFCVILASPTVSPLKVGLLLSCTSSVSIPSGKSFHSIVLNTFSKATSQTSLNSFFGDHYFASMSSWQILHGRQFSLKRSSLNRNGLITTQGGITTKVRILRCDPAVCPAFLAPHLISYSFSAAVPSHFVLTASFWSHPHLPPPNSNFHFLLSTLLY